MISFSPQNISFRGYDARPLKHVVMRYAAGYDLEDTATQLASIGKKHNFDLIFETGDSFTKSVTTKDGETYTRSMGSPWIQDLVHFTKNGAIVGEEDYGCTPKLSNKFNLDRDVVSGEDFIAGGNVFFVKNGESEQVLIGEFEDREKAEKVFKNKDIIQVPQADFHLDLFIRPLRDGVVLVADDNMTIDIMEEAHQRLEYMAFLKEDMELFDKARFLDDQIRYMKTAMENNKHYKNTDEVTDVLKGKGFTVVPVPGRIYFNDITRRYGFSNKLNYMSAIVQENKKGDLVYITNKRDMAEWTGLSNKVLKEIGLDFEQIFKDAVSPYIKPKNVYFLEGEKSTSDNFSYSFTGNIPWILESKGGGLHCLSAEVPAEICG